MNFLDTLSPYAERELRRALMQVVSSDSRERVLNVLRANLEAQGKAMVLKRETATQDVSDTTVQINRGMMDAV